MADFRMVPPDRLPYPATLLVDCPCCGHSVEYLTSEDDAGAFYTIDFPVCDGCGILIDVPSVRIVRADGIYLQKG